MPPVDNINKYILLLYSKGLSLRKFFKGINETT
jgi:hypothetical protein